MASLDSLTEDVAHNLSAAVDLSKILGVFNTFVGIIKDQQAKLDKADEEIRSLKEKMEFMTGGGSDRLQKLEKKLDDFIQEIQGGDDMDKSILHADISPFAAFNPIAPIMEEDDDDETSIDSKSVGASPTRLPRLEEENSVASLERDSVSVHDDKKEPLVLTNDDPGNFIAEDNSPTPPLRTEAPGKASARQSMDFTAPSPTVQTGSSLEDDDEETPVANSAPMPEPGEDIAKVEVRDESPRVLDDPVPQTDGDVAPSDKPPQSSEGGEEFSATEVSTTAETIAVPPTTAPSLRTSLVLPPTTDAETIVSRSPSNEATTPSSRTNSGRPTSARPHRSASVDSGLPPRSARSYSIVVSDQRSDDAPILDEISSTLPLVIEAMRRSSSRPVSARHSTMMRPLSASTSLVVSGSGVSMPGGRPTSGAASRPLSGLNSGRKLPSVAVAVRRKMDANRLPWLTPARAKRFVRAIKMRGRFILISKRIMEESRRKYGAASLKNRIDLLESDLTRVNARLESMKDTMKKNHAAVKELVSPDVNKLLEDIGKFLKGINSSMGNVDNFVRLILTLKETDMSMFSSAGREQMMNEFSEKLQQTVLRDLKDQFDARFSILSKEYVSKQDVSNMLRQGTAVDQNMDANHIRLLQLLDRTMKPSLEILDNLRVEGERRMQERLMSQQQELLATLDSRQIDMHRDLEERMRTLATQIQSVAKKPDESNRIDDEFAVMRAKLKKLEDERETLQAAREKETQQRQAEHEALKILQRRLANISIDKLMEELKDVRDEVKDRPSTHQVEHMVGKIEKTFKSHLGENVNGLTNLVGQVYKYLQTKVDREDIRNLITSKLMQMEQELIYREEEMLSAAGTAVNAARCISCGQLPAVQRPRTTQQASSRSGIGSPQTGKYMDDEVVESPPTTAGTQPAVPVPLHPNAANSAYSMQGNEQVYSLLTGQVGLRPLHLQHHPLQPRDPYHQQNNGAGTGMHGSRPHTMATNRVKPATADKIPEPMFRKARMAAHMKEMVKVSTPAMDAYGYHAGSNPFFVTDTSSSLNAPGPNAGYAGGKLFHPSEGQPSLATLHNTFAGGNHGGGGGASSGSSGLRGAGASIINSQSLTALPPMNHGLDNSHSVLSSGSRENHGSRRVSAVNIDAKTLADMGQASAF